MSGLDDALVDASVGAKIRERRKALGISQMSLAEKLGVTFQQVQKYEKGTNRVSASKLYQIAGILRVELEDLFYIKSSTIEPSKFCSESEVTSFVRTPEGQRLNQAFVNISDERVRRKFIDFLKTLG